jgi:DMSO/TMAO reductase YedYZ molybdopterin-dependent catalytic subunit
VATAGAGEVRVGRRVFLGVLGLGAAGILFGARAQDWLERVVAPVISKDGTGLAALLPIGRFRIYTVTGDLPSRSTAEYRLRVAGMVDTPITLTFDDITAMTPMHLTRDFQCVTGWRVSDVKWKGVLLRDVLDRAGVQARATALQFTSFDGVYTESLTMEQARRDDVIVAYELEGDVLSREHGGPVRLYVAPMYGYKSLKWLDAIHVVDEVRPGYWEQLGYDVDGWVGESNNRDDPVT